MEDAEGHVYYEVDHLSQDVIYVNVTNRNSDKFRVKNILKPMSVPRRYVAIIFQVQLRFNLDKAVM